jgi:hypothetical protein
MLHSALAAFSAVMLTASHIPHTNVQGYSVLLVTQPAAGSRQNETIAMQRLAAAIEARLGLRETGQEARSTTDARVACPDGVDYVLWVDAATIRPMTSGKRLAPRLSATLTRCADRLAVSASRWVYVAGTDLLNDPAVTTAYRTLEPLVLDDIVAREAASKTSGLHAARRH